MKRVFLVVALLGCIGAAFVVGSHSGRKQAAAGAGDGRKILYYVDPMNPSHTSAKPGLAPCGMKMEPVYADSILTAVAGQPLRPGSVRLTTQKQQLIGVRTGVAERKPVRHTVRLLGKVAPDETRSYQVTAPAEGWITEAMPKTFGNSVRKDETLALFYSPTFITAAQAFFNALGYIEQMKTNSIDRAIQQPGLAQFNVKQYNDSLRNLGVSQRQIDDMLRTRKYTEHIEIVAPADGFISARNVSHGQRFEKGTELYRVIDLSRVWILADVFERDSPMVQPGVEAAVSVPGRTEVFHAQLSATLPQFDSVSRTLKLRFETDNPDQVLKPDMFVDLQFNLTLPEALVAPAEAVIDSGMRKTVFVDRGEGVFEPREIQTGWRVGDLVQVLNGLMPGEKIVTSGNFLLDSESRMKLAASGVHGTPEIDPVCGMAVDEQQARARQRFAGHQGKTYFFCNDGCKTDFTADPDKYLNPKAPESTAPPAPVAGKAIDPVCEMKVTEAVAREAGRTSVFQGVTYYFCNNSCKEEFDENPAKFVKAPTAAPSHASLATTNQTPGHRDQSHR